MGIQSKGDREKFSQLRQSLLHLANEIRGLDGTFLFRSAGDQRDGL